MQDARVLLPLRQVSSHINYCLLMYLMTLLQHRRLYIVEKLYYHEWRRTRKVTPKECGRGLFKAASLNWREDIRFLARDILMSSCSINAFVVAIMKRGPEPCTCNSVWPGYRALTMSGFETFHLSRFCWYRLPLAIFHIDLIRFVVPASFHLLLTFKL
jgi:hypothetical protein